MYVVQSGRPAGLQGPNLAKGDVFARSSMHCWVSFEFPFWPFLACQNENNLLIALDTA